jgi:hypothetical protein
MGWVGRLLLRAVQRRAGRLTETWPIVAHAPGILKGWAAEEFFLDRTRRVEPRLRKLAELKVAVMVGCPG